MQLSIYEEYNKMLRVMHSEDHQARHNETHANFLAKVEAKSKTLNSAEGETISWDDY